MTGTDIQIEKMPEQDLETNTLTGVLLVNLGTPNSYEIPDIRKYLNEFLSDPRVIDIPALARFMLVKGIILPFRPAKIKESYQYIWTDQGSPLIVYGKAIKNELQKNLGPSYQVELGMRYGNPSLAAALAKLQKQNIQKLFILPLFPQYAAATTASVFEKVMQILQSWENLPEISFKNYFYNDQLFLDAFATVAEKYHLSDYDHIIFSFHGLPERHIKKGDYHNHCKFGSCCEQISEKNRYCYRAQCFQTARLLAEKLNMNKEDYTICFQSRLGKTPWIQPYTDQSIISLAQKGYKKLLVFCPAFVSDCLETIYEISVENNKIFQEHGGETVQLVESLNDHPAWTEALKQMIIRETT